MYSVQPAQVGPVKNATEAMTIAMHAAVTAGFMYVYVTEVKKEDKKWIVTLWYFQRKFVVIIDSETGDVVQWSEHRPT
jgi:hypothetical protein